jgi:glycosyltransferase involved in cell wall biosynthesis
LEKYKVPASAPTILSITLEPISSSMAGPAIRCVELSKQLAGQQHVTVFSPRESDLTSEQICDSDNFTLVAGTSKGDVYRLARDADILFLQPNVLKAYPLLARLDKYVIVDLYDPILLSILAQYEGNNTSLNASYNLMHQVLERHMALADFSICASERQRDYWLGRYCALGRLTPDLYKFDRSFRKLIDVVPFGLSQKEPARTGPGMKGSVPQIASDDFVLLWGGGIWNWFDPITIIEAVSKLVPKYPRLKLYFLGVKSPNPEVPLMEMAVRAQQRAQELNIYNKNVFFCETWTSYEDRVNYLLDADAAVSAHFDLPETRFSFRTRVLDYLWAGLPILTTCGDQLADMIAAGQAGEALPYGNVDSWANAIARLMESADLQRKYQQGSSELAKQFHWNNVSKPLLEFCANPHRLPKYKRVKMPSLAQRAAAVYSRGGKELVLRRSKELLEDVLRR